MSNEITKEPEIRFDGYKGDWEQRKLGDVTERVRGNDGRMDLPTLTISAGNGWLDQRERFSGNIAGKEQKNYTLLHKGELSYNHGNSKLAKYGAVFELRTYEEALVPRVYHSFKVKKEAIADFIEYMFATKRPDRELGKLVSSGARMDGLLNINFDEFMGIKISLPTVVEQVSISELLRTLDDTITLHQRELDLLEQTKQTYLQKMFPKTGEDKPEIRFAGFIDAWKQRKLGDVFTERSERSSEGELISVTINSGVVKASELDRKDNSSNDKSNYKKVEVGDIAYNSMRMWQGASGYSSYDGILSPAYTVIIPKEGIDSKFFAYDFKRYDMIQTFKRNSQGLTSDTWNLKFPTLKSVKVMVPCMEEQTKISNFFERLDTTIALHQRELDSLKEMKKTLLQKMFV